LHELAIDLIPKQIACQNARSEAFKKCGFNETREFDYNAWNAPEFWKALVDALKKLQENGAKTVPYVEGVSFPLRPKDFTIQDIEKWFEHASSSMRNTVSPLKPNDHLVPK